MLKFSKSDVVRPLVERKIDELYAARIDALLGPMAALHARKRMLVLTGMLADDGVTDRASEQDAELLVIDAQRRDYKARVRAAASTAEIYEIVAELGIK